MEDAFEIGRRLKREAQETKEHNQPDASWQMLRSDIYVRDKGICWVCNTFVELKDYDLGHLIDRCNGGQDAYDNLTVMHKICNLSKPKHTTLEEAIKWKLTPSYLTERPQSLFDDTKSIYKPYPYYQRKHTHTTSNQLTLPTDVEKERANKQFIESYFQAHPELQNKSSDIRLEAIKLLSQILNMPIKNVEPIQPPIIPLNKTDMPITYKRRGGKVRLEPMIATTITDPELLAKIKNNSICWIQGRPEYTGNYSAPMWKILPPPYKQENLLTARQTPPGANDNGLKGVKATMQVINGILLPDFFETTINLGYLRIHILNNNGQPLAKLSNTNNGNTGKYSIGFGKKQIPIYLWKKAKAQGLTFREFINTYKNSQQNPDA